MNMLRIIEPVYSPCILDNNASKQKNISNDNSGSKDECKSGFHSVLQKCMEEMEDRKNCKRMI